MSRYGHRGSGTSSGLGYSKGREFQSIHHRRRIMEQILAFIAGVGMALIIVLTIYLIKTRDKEQKR